MSEADRNLLGSVEKGALLLTTASTKLRVCRHGILQYFSNDEYIGRSLDHYGEFSEAETCLFRSLVSSGDVVVEIGANIGTHTVFLSQAVGASGAVVAFEPQAHVFRVLNANLALNECWNVQPLQMGVGDSNTVMSLPVYDPAAQCNMGGVSLIEGEGEGDLVQVPVRTLDSLALPKVDLIKVDVEGMENAVLRGARDTIRRCRPILYLENDREQHSKALLEQLFELDYHVWWHLPLMFNPDNYLGNTQRIFPDGLVSVNVLCFPAEANIPVNYLARIHSVDDNWQVSGRSSGCF